MPAADRENSNHRLSVELYRPPATAQTEPQVTAEPAVIKETVVEVDLLPTVEPSRRVYLEWSNISCHVQGFGIPKNPFVESAKNLKRLVSGPSKNSGAPPKRQILYSVTGHASPGEITALMGPSGSGKTSLVSVLGGRAPKTMTKTGEVKFNGVEMSKTIRRSLGYVSQDDLLFANLTVYETLYYAALLKLPKSMTKAQKLERVEGVIGALGLTKCRDTLIGGGFRRGVSGGERKRVAVGHELLTNPSVLILDEPTSGLDSTTAMKLIVNLKSLALGGRVVLTTIHQPSSRLFQQLSNVMLLSEGKVLYYGSCHSVVDWFDRFGYPLPYGINVPEFILDLANGDISGEGRDGETSRVYLIDQMTTYLAKNPAGYLTDASAPLGGVIEKPLGDATSKTALNGVTMKKSDRWGASFLDQVAILTSRAARNRRFESLSIQNMIQSLCTTVVVVALWWQSGDGNTLLVASDLVSLLFFVLLSVQFGVLFKAIYTFPTVFRVMVKERTSGMYRMSAFYLAETFCDLPLDFSIPTLLVTAVYWGAHLRQTFLAFIGTLGTAILAGLNVQTLGLLLGATVKNPKSAIAFSSILMMTMTLATGFWVRNIPSSLNWLKYLATPYWAYRLILQIQFHDTNYVNCGGINETQLPPEECKPIDDLGEELNLPIDVNGAYWPSILVLVGLLLFLRVITYYVLRAKTKY